MDIILKCDNLNDTYLKVKAIEQYFTVVLNYFSQLNLVFFSNFKHWVHFNLKGHINTDVGGSAEGLAH